MASYKALKEDFVSGLTGGEVIEINYVTAVAPAALILWSALQTRQSFFVSSGPIAWAVDFLLNVGCILLSTTLYSSSPILLNVLLLSPAALLHILPASETPKASKTKKASRRTAASLPSLPRRPFLTAYRGAMMIITCLAILAVDFPIFPRRFAKVENWGTSLMDMGVGSFVFSAGLVAARPLLKEQASGKSLLVRLRASFRHSLPLIILGFIRLWSVKGLDYAEHVTEYGVHWNFFFTLAFVPPFVALCESVTQFIPSYAALALILSGVYEVALDFTDLKAFVLTAPRTNLFSKNREGIFSLFGYLAIFLAGQSIGLLTLPRKVSPSGDASFQRKKLLTKLLVWSAFWIVLFQVTTSYNWGLGLTVSRRLANLPYVIWVAAFNCGQLTAFCAIETYFFPGVYKAIDPKTEEEECEYATSRVLAAFNRNGLAIFLLANVLTGLVNLTIPTLNVTNGQAMSILIGYAAVLTATALVLDAWNISIKL